MPGIRPRGKSTNSSMCRCHENQQALISNHRSMCRCPKNEDGSAFQHLTDVKDKTNAFFFFCRGGICIQESHEQRPNRCTLQDSKLIISRSEHLGRKPFNLKYQVFQICRGRKVVSHPTLSKLIAMSKYTKPSAEPKHQQAKSKKDTLKAQAQSENITQKVNEVFGTVSTNSVLAVFEKMDSKGTLISRG